MGLFDFLRNPEKLERRKRPSMPLDVLEHLNFECEGVSATIYHQDVLDGIHEPTVGVVVASEQGQYGYDGMLADGTVVGNLRPERLARIALNGDRSATAEVVRPVHRTTDHVELYLPLNEETLKADAEAREHKSRMADLTVWVNLDGSKWNGPTFESGQIEYHDADFVLTERKNAKPLLSVVCNGATLMTFNARMKAYRELMDRSDLHIRLLIVKRKEGEYGTFYKVGFYF